MSTVSATGFDPDLTKQTLVWLRESVTVRAELYGRRSKTSEACYATVVVLHTAEAFAKAAEKDRLRQAKVFLDALIVLRSYKQILRRRPDEAAAWYASYRKQVMARCQTFADQTLFVLNKIDSRILAAEDSLALQEAQTGQ